jgi:hypothetical protein
MTAKSTCAKCGMSFVPSEQHFAPFELESSLNLTFLGNVLGERFWGNVMATGSPEGGGRALPLQAAAALILAATTPGGPLVVPPTSDSQEATARDDNAALRIRVEIALSK